MINKMIMLLMAILFFNGCSVQKKVVNLFQRGHTKQQSFKAKIPFEYRLGLVIIKVEINNKTYDFVFDSGATNVLSKELAETLGSKGLITVNNRDVQGKSKPMDFTTIESLTIGGIKFEDTASGIGDFNQAVEVGCLEIDGIIGANLMRLAVWKIDYRNQIITITNTKASLSLDRETKKIPFYTDLVYQPYCKIKVNEVEEKNINIDLGSDGGFNLSFNTYKKIENELSQNKKMMEYGYLGTGFYGYGKIDSIYYLQAANLSIGALNLENQIIKFSKSLTPTIGTAFFKNYDLVMNWKDKELLLTPHTVYDNQKLTHKGIYFNYKDGALSIATLFKNSEAEKLGLQLGDKIIKMDGKDCVAMTQEAYCELFDQTNSFKQIKDIVVSRAGKQLFFDLKDNVFIE